MRRGDALLRDVTGREDSGVRSGGDEMGRALPNSGQHWKFPEPRWLQRLRREDGVRFRVETVQISVSTQLGCEAAAAVGGPATLPVLTWTTETHRGPVRPHSELAGRAIKLRNPPIPPTPRTLAASFY